jgi:hypothetical protein
MSSLQDVAEDIDETSVEMLRLLFERGGEADASQLRDAMEGVSVDSFNYRRREHLVPHGLVETNQPEPYDDGRIPPKELVLTSRGEKYLEEMVDLEPSDLDGRVERLEQKIEELEETNQELRDGNRELRRTIEQMDATAVMNELEGVKRDITGLRDDLSSLRNRVSTVESHPVVEADHSTTAVNVGLTLGNTCKKLLEEEVGEERVEEKRQMMETRLTEDGHLVGMEE